MSAGGAVPAGGSVVVDLSGVVPAGASAVVVNLTATDVTADTVITAWPDGVQRPVASNLNLVPGQTAANQATVALGAGSKIDLYNHVGTVDLIVDVAGYYTPDSGLGFTPLSPSRVLDTRATGGAFGAGETRQLDLHNSVPASARAVVLNLTGTDVTTSTYVQAWPGGDRPVGSSINLDPGQTRANLVTVGLGAGSTVELFNHAGSMDLVADLAGYYSDDSTSTFTPLSPERVLDTRSVGLNAMGDPIGTLGPDTTAKLTLSSRVPMNATAAVMNVTGTNPTASTYESVWPDGQARPSASNLNLEAGQTVPNSATVALDADRSVDLYNHVGSVDLVVDLSGYFAPKTFTCTAGCVYYWGGLPGNRSSGGTPAKATLAYGLSDVTSIAGNRGVDLAVRSDGTVWAWGLRYGDWVLGGANPCGNGAADSDCEQNVPEQVPGLTGVTQVAASPNTAERDSALRSDGTVWMFWAPFAPAEGGTIAPQQIGNLSGITQIVGGTGGPGGSLGNGYALRSDGTVWAWGNVQGGRGNPDVCPTPTPGPNCGFYVANQVKGLTNIVSIGGGDGTGYAVQSDGSVWVWGSMAASIAGTGSGDSELPQHMQSLSGIKSVVGGDNFAYALTNAGSVLSWGVDDVGQLGDGNATTGWQFSPRPVSGLSGVASIGEGVTISPSTAFAVKTDGSVWAWGSNVNGQLGTGDTTASSSAVPVQVPGVQGALAVAATAGNGLALVPHQG